MSDLRNAEWRLSYPETVYTFGTPATPAWHLTTPDIGDIDIRVADVDRPRQDGRAFGVDYRGGRTVTFDLGIRAHTSQAAREEAAILQRVWRADPVRSTPGAVAELRTVYDGRERVMYGRPRRLALNYSDTTVNQFVGAVADFACVDDLFYSPDVDSVSFGIAPSLGGGLIAPLRSPLSTTRSSDRSMGFKVVSEMPVWPVIRINGPITNPVINVGEVFSWEVRLTLAYDEWVEIDTRPWSRYALRNGTANVTGTVRGTRLGKSAIPAGNYEIGFKGTDPTGTASAKLSWQATYSAL